MKYPNYLIVIISIVLFSCELKKNNGTEKDFFYTDKGFDLRRLPLIKPYELLKYQNEWSLNLQTTNLLTLDIDRIKGVNVSKNIILVYSEGGTEVRNRLYEKMWFIIDPSNQKEMAFYDYELYSDSLRAFNITDTALNSPDDTYDDFYDSGKLKWRK